MCSFINDSFVEGEGNGEKCPEKCPGAFEIARRGAQPMTSGSQVAGSWRTMGISDEQVLALPWSWCGVPAGSNSEQGLLWSCLGERRQASVQCSCEERTNLCGESMPFIHP